MGYWENIVVPAAYMTSHLKVYLLIGRVDCQKFSWDQGVAPNIGDAELTQKHASSNIFARILFVLSCLRTITIDLDLYLVNATNSQTEDDLLGL